MKKLFAAVAVLAVVALAIPAMAADAPGYGVTIGGRIKADMGWQFLPGDSDDRAVNRNNTDSTIANFFTTLNTNSYLRALFTSADKTTGAHIEFGFGTVINRDNEGGGSYNNGVGLRFAYGWWKVGTCKLLVGQFAGRLGDRYYPGSNLGHSKSHKTDLAGFGFIGGTRNPKVALQMDINDNFGFEIAIGQAGAETPTSPGDFGSTDSYLPRLELVLDFKFGDFMITPGGGISYQKAKLIDGLDDADDNVLSYLLWLPMQYKSGPLTIMLNGFYGQNMDTDWTGEWGDFQTGGVRAYQWGGQPGALPFVNIATGEVTDSKSWGVGAAVKYAFTEQVSVNLGGGFVNTKNDAWGTGDNNNDYNRWGAFVAVPYKVTSNFTIAPEVAYYNFGDKVGTSNVDAGDEWLVGVHFQFLF